MPKNTYFEDVLKNDKLNFDANPSIEQRLMYHFQLKVSSSKIKKNQLLPFIETLFLSKFAGIKIGLASLLIVVMIGFNQFNAPKEMNLQTDTVAVINIHDTVRHNSNDSVIVY